MSRLRVFSETDPRAVLLDTEDASAIEQKLFSIGAEFRRWSAPSVEPETLNEVVARICIEDIDRIKKEGYYEGADIVNINHFPPEKISELRGAFGREHTHDGEDEVRAFVQGTGEFYLHPQGEVCVLQCAAGDLMKIPGGMKHWFKMGNLPNFTALRFFKNKAGWKANYTGDNIAERFSNLDADLQL